MIKQQWEPAQLPQLVTIATMEQYVLAGTRATTLADRAQRSTMFFTGVSSTLIALEGANPLQWCECQP